MEKIQNMLREATQVHFMLEKNSYLEQFFKNKTNKITNILSRY